MRPFTPVQLCSILVFAALSVPSACATADEDTYAPTLETLRKNAEPLGTILDERVAELLPAGSYTVRLDDTLGGGTVAEGYVHLPAGGDPLTDCTYEITVDQTRGGGSTGSAEYATVYTMVKPSGGDSFVKIVRTTSSDDDEQAAVGVWFSGDDPNMFGPLILFPPFHLVERGGMGYYWCGVGRIDEVARLADPGTGLLAWDSEQFAYVAAVLRDDWFRQIGELGGWGVDDWSNDLDTYLVPMYEGVLENSPTRVTKQDDGTVTIVAGGDRMTLTFTPTAERGIERPAGTETFLEKVAKADGDLVKLGELLLPDDLG